MRPQDILSMKNELIQQGIRRRDDLHFQRFVPIILTIAYAHDSNPRLHGLAARGSGNGRYKILESVKGTST
jgi:hypothetical protein